MEKEKRQEEERKRRLEYREQRKEMLKLKLKEQERKQKKMKGIADKKSNLLHIESEPKFFKNIFEATSTIVRECKFNITENEMESRAVDPAHVSMYVIKIPKDAVDEYRCKGEHEIGVDVDKILKILKRRTKTDKDFRIDEYEGDTNLYFTWKTETGTFGRQVNNVDPAGVPDTKIPNLDLEIEFPANVSDLLKFIREAEDVSNYMSVTSNGKEIVFAAEGDEDRTNYVVPGKYKKCRSMFSIDYMLNAIKSMKPFFKEVTIRLGTENPIEIKGKDNIEMTVLLAPRIESE